MKHTIECIVTRVYWGSPSSHIVSVLIPLTLVIDGGQEMVGDLVTKQSRSHVGMAPGNALDATLAVDGRGGSRDAERMCVRGNVQVKILEELPLRVSTEIMYSISKREAGQGSRVDVTHHLECSWTRIRSAVP